MRTMSKLHRYRVVIAVAAFALFTVGIGWIIGLRTVQAAEKSNSASATPENVEQGKYLVHHVAKCIECHTPRDSGGNLIMTRLLRGAPIPIKGPRYAPPWAAQSVSLAGLGNYEESFVRYLLTHGVRPDGSAPESPMPSFQLKMEDANAVIAYLKTLPPS